MTPPHMKCLRQDDSLPIWDKELNVNHADDYDDPLVGDDLALGVGEGGAPRCG